jgi:hypothetical protein
LIADRVSFVVEDPRITAVNVPFNRSYLPCTRDNGVEVRFDTIVVFHKALTYPHAALVGLLAHELAHSVALEDDHLADEDAADNLVCQWGFSKELEALTSEHEKEKGKQSGCHKSVEA